MVHERMGEMMGISVTFSDLMPHEASLMMTLYDLLEHTLDVITIIYVQFRLERMGKWKRRQERRDA